MDALSTIAVPAPSTLLHPVDLAAAEEIIQAADAVPAIAMRFDDEPMLAVLVAVAVFVAQEVDQHPAVLALDADAERDLLRLGGEIVHEQHPVVAPVVAHHQDR